MLPPVCRRCGQGVVLCAKDLMKGCVLVQWMETWCCLMTVVERKGMWEDDLVAVPVDPDRSTGHAQGYK